MKNFIEKLALWLAKPGVQAKFNGWMTIIWLVMLPITLMFTKSFSTVLWVAFISAWALFATHLGAWIAALVNVKAERIDDRTEQNAHLLAIEQTENRLLLEMENVASSTHERMESQHIQMMAMLESIKKIT